MPIIDVITLSLGFVLILFPSFLYLRNPKSLINRVLLYLSFVAGPLWSIAIWGYNQNFSVDLNILFLDLIYLVSVFTAFLTYWLTHVYPYKTKIKFLEVLLVFGVGFFLIYEIFFTNNFVIEILYHDGIRTPQLGSVYAVWFLWFTLLFLWRIIQMSRNMSSMSVLEKRKMKYVIAGFSVVGVGVIPTNMVLPYLGNFDYIWIGPVFITIMITLITYGVSTTRFVNVRSLVIKMIFTLQSILLPVAFGVLLFLGIREFDLITEEVPLVFSILLPSIFTFLIVRKYYEGKEDISETFLSHSSAQLNLDEIGKTIKNLLIENIHCDKFNYIVLGNREEILYSFEDFNKEDLVYLQQYWFYHKDPSKLIVLSELEYLRVTSLEENNFWKYKRFISLIDYMNEQKWQIVMPVLLQDEKIALILIGDHESSALYSNNEISALLNIRSAIQVTLDRGLLHQQTEDFNEKLKSKVNEQTKELQKKVEELQEARRKEADMIDIMGHELRTPATIVKLNAEILDGIIKKKSLIDLEKYVTRIKEGVDREIKLINTLLSSAKLEGDKIELNPEEVDIANEIEMSLHAYEKDAEIKGLQLINLVPSDLPSIYGDHARVVEVVNNLISNAVKYTHEGSVTISSLDLGTHIKIDIKDTGTGIPEENLKKLGTKFYRVQTYIKSNASDDVEIVRPGGTGLGLYVVFNLVEKMGGKITVESKVNEGSTFSFTLPKYTNQDNRADKIKSNNMFERLGLKK